MKSIWASTRENLFSLFANNKGADQPAHPRYLVSAFAICLLECIISKLATGEISIFQLVSVAEETGFSLPMLETRRQVLSCRGPFISCVGVLY